MHGDNGAKMTIEQQCEILKISKSAYYDNVNKEVMRTERKAAEDKIRISQAGIVFNEWVTHSTYGYQKMAKHLRKRFKYDWAGEKLVRRLYGELNIKAQRPVFKTTIPGKAPYGKFPYLLKNKAIMYPNQVMATDITYIKTVWGMMYFTAVIDWCSRKILSWALSRDMKTEFCIGCVKEAFEKYGVPAIFNTDCGSQYTSAAFIEMLMEYGAAVSMDGVGRCRDNIIVERTWRTLKYEWIFLRDYGSESELRNSLAEFVEFFNGERIHQGLGYITPDEAYQKGLFNYDSDNEKLAA